jgi:drug/metabolite transporter (DMT)-like permease
MRQGTGLLPPSLSDSPLSARLWLALAAGAGSAVCAYAGLYPRFDEGTLRGVIALTSVPFAAAVVAYALSARTPLRALGTALMTAGMLGVASTVIPGVILTWDRPNELGFVAIFGTVFGAITGLTYGVPLAILASLGHRHMHAQTHEGTDRAARIAGTWLFIVAAVGVIGACVFDPPKMDWHTDTLVAPSPLPALVGCAVAVVGWLAFLVSTMRLARRARWLERVRAGLEPSFRVRAMDLRDRIDGLPRLGNGGAVLEFLAGDSPDGSAGSAYRTAATGTAVAIVRDDMCTVSSFTVAPAAMSASATSG